MKHKVLIATVCLFGSAPLFAQAQEPARKEQKTSASATSTTKPSKPKQHAGTGKAKPLSTVHQNKQGAARREEKIVTQ